MSKLELESGTDVLLLETGDALLLDKMVESIPDWRQMRGEKLIILAGPQSPGGLDFK